MASFYIVTPNPYDFSGDELDEVVKVVKSADPSLDLEAGAQYERGYGVDTYEVLDVIATTGGAAAAVNQVRVALTALTKWTRARWTRDRDEHPDENPRPRMIRVLYGPTGEVLLRVAIDEPEGEPEEVDSDHPDSD
ncbi:hypothetical protein ABTY98_25745 [Streptomyces sp. NPDC096040]|uniref:hypothetical protein n=1 Tax=Streptomyces sp. NPDC096040 TaxID=3155541 RepID=UPI003317515B